MSEKKPRSQRSKEQDDHRSDQPQLVEKIASKLSLNHQRMAEEFISQEPVKNATGEVLLPAQIDGLKYGTKNVREYIAARRADILARSNITAEELIADLVEAKEYFRERQEYLGMIVAIRELSKITGLDKREKVSANKDELLATFVNVERKYEIR